MVLCTVQLLEQVTTDLCTVPSRTVHRSVLYTLLHRTVVQFTTTVLCNCCCKLYNSSVTQTVVQWGGQNFTTRLHRTVVQFITVLCNCCFKLLLYCKTVLCKTVLRRTVVQFITTVLCNCCYKLYNSSVQNCFTQNCCSVYNSSVQQCNCCYKNCTTVLCKTATQNCCSVYNSSIQLLL